MSRGGRRPGAGRPKGSKTKAKATAAPLSDRQRVALCVADGMDAPTIAAALGIPEGELRADFAHALEHGGAIVRAQQLAALATAAEAGNAAAAKALLAIAGKPEPERPAHGAGGPDLATRALRILEGGRR